MMMMMMVRRCFLALNVVALLTLPLSSEAFVVQTTVAVVVGEASLCPARPSSASPRLGDASRRSVPTLLRRSSSSSSENDGVDEDRVSGSTEDRPTTTTTTNDLEIVDLDEEDIDEVSDELWEEVDSTKPPLAAVMKELLGINVFTYVLAGLIVISLSSNVLLGPGWLGQMMGLEGVGTFTERSPSLPDVVDLNKPENLLW